MTPEEMYAAVDARRQELDLPWWRIAIQLQCTSDQVRWMRRGHVSKPLRARVEAWLGEAS
ncbi:hypothetical protein ACIBK9_47375 [Nonomuraea sp. NPDC050227]|uniref:hypothetical protein n=1 Tax=Nonomuraea sp. NPDC050227 TaxID=3364360 RepID=UPI0037B6B9E3